MTIDLPLDRMTTKEKVDLMNVIWEDLARTPDEIESPAWHEDVLKETQRRVESGEDHFIDWEEAKADIIRQTS